MKQAFATSKEAEDFVNEVRDWQAKTGGICVASNIVLSPIEIADPNVEAILETKATIALDGMKKSVRTLVQQYLAEKQAEEEKATGKNTK